MSLEHSHPHDHAEEHRRMRRADEMIPVVSFLAGSRRGDTLRLGGASLTIGTDVTSDIRLPDDTEPLPLGHHATLVRRGRTYQIVAAPGAGVWVNGEQVSELVLASGDVLEVGRDGSVLRFRLYPGGAGPYKSLPEIFADCAECARAEQGALRKAGTLARVVPRELATQTTRRFRILTVTALAIVAITTGMTARRNVLLERELLSEIERFEGVSDLVGNARASMVSDQELTEVLSQLRTTSERVEVLEAASTATSRVIAAAGGAIVFLQGSYHFVDPGTERPLRLILGPDGRPMRNPQGHPALSLDGDGPPLEIFLTGTGFVATAEGLVLTNRHVALPWEFDDAAKGILESGFEPRWGRFQAFLSGREEPHAVDVVVASDEADLAVLQMTDIVGEVPHINLAIEPPAPGDAIIVMGYPLGLRALMARSDESFVTELRQDGVTDFFEQARRIAVAGFMQPLATRGIVGQVTTASIVYDAETTSGGSGGPVIDLDGNVVAVNMAILPEFGGSNLGVPSGDALALIRRARGD